MKNLEIARILNNLADILELQEVRWKPQAYRKAAQSLESLSEDVAELAKGDKLQDIPGVGEHIAAKIVEYLTTGKIKAYEKLKKKVKVDIAALNEVPGLGPKKIKLLYNKYGVKNVSDLQKLIQQKKIPQIPGFGKKTEELLTEGIKFVKSKPQRFLYIQAYPLVEKILSDFRKLSAVQKIEVAGSFRRGKETVGDLDFLVISNKPDQVMKHFNSLSDIKKVVSKGITRSSILLQNNLQIDLRVVKEKEFGSALLYFIGNKQHNVALRKLALKKGYTLSEYGLFKLKGKQWVAGRTEEEIYTKLGLQFIPPEIRSNTGELEAAAKKKLPQLVTKVNGYFHHHTTYSDGNNSLLGMAQKAEQLKLKFISFNDHYGPLGIYHPLDEKKLSAYLKEIEKVRTKVNLKIFSGVEVDILKDGTLPLPSKKLNQFDVVIAAVHASTKQSSEQMTKRICAALENYPINILAHPTDRLIQKRPSLNLDLSKIFDCAKQNDVFLEVNCSPYRMDLNGENVKSAISAGCKLAIGTDAHDLSQLDFAHFGLNMVRRGWAEKKDVLNCWSLPKINKALQR